LIDSCHLITFSTLNSIEIKTVDRPHCPVYPVFMFGLLLVRCEFIKIGAYFEFVIILGKTSFIGVNRGEGVNYWGK
jgi:hypothetical protein